MKISLVYIRTFPKIVVVFVVLFFAIEGILNNVRDSSVMDTLPLNGNHANNYSMASSEYLSDCVQILDRNSSYGTQSNHKETTLEKKILKELASNYIPSYINNHERATTERNHNLMNKVVNSSLPNGGDYFYKKLV